MAATNPSRCNFTARVAARTQLARELRKPQHAGRVNGAGLLDDDLGVIETEGEKAERHDREQHAALADQRAALVSSAQRWRDLLTQEEALRNRLPAVIRDLDADAATRVHAVWLDNVTFDRYRIRTRPAAEGEQRAEPKRERVARGDKVSAAQGLVHFTGELLDDDRSPIVAAFERRGIDRDYLVKMGGDAEALVADFGKSSKMTSPEASRLETEAVMAQKERWKACRRMLREAVAGDPTLERLWAAC